MKKLDKALEIACIVLVLNIVGIVFLQVWLRYVFAKPQVWVEEWTRYSLVWLTFFGSYLALRRNKHIKMEIGYNLMSPPARRAVDIAGHLSIAAFAVYMTGYGFSYSFKLMNSWPESFHIPMGLFYLIIPLGGLLFVVNSINELWLSLRPLLKNSKEKLPLIEAERREAQ